jgi:protein SCO1/2
MPVRFYSDLIQGKVVVINAFFTSCEGSCPVMAATLERLQDQLGDRLGRDVSIVSISVDAERDTPAKLKAFGARFHARPGWHFLTGARSDVSEVLRKLGQYVDAPADHSALILAGNDRTGLWKKVFALAKPDEVIATIQTVIQDDGRDERHVPGPPSR